MPRVSRMVRPLPRGAFGLLLSQRIRVRLVQLDKAVGRSGVSRAATVSGAQWPIFLPVHRYTGCHIYGVWSEASRGIAVPRATNPSHLRTSPQGCFPSWSPHREWVRPRSVVLLPPP